LQINDAILAKKKNGFIGARLNSNEGKPDEVFKW